MFENGLQADALERALAADYGRGDIAERRIVGVWLERLRAAETVDKRVEVANAFRRHIANLGIDVRRVDIWVSMNMVGD